jgi:hypothetical protein
VKRIIGACIAVLLLNCSSTGEQAEKYDLRYDFAAPENKLILPELLNEISGQTIIDDSTIACVQDENGIIFIYDTRKNSIRQQITFAGDGDYEAICRVNDDLYILRSDGVLYRVTRFASASPSTEEYATGIPADNSEGLCYDSLRNALLIACKSRIGDSKENKDLRAVYAFDLGTNKLNPDPAYEFYVSEMIAFADAHGIDLPTKEKKKGSVPQLKFRMSAIGVHPDTHELYILSATDHMLFVYDYTTQQNGAGKILHLELLNEKMFNKAEGISFYANGDVLITNEAQDNKPTLLRFNYIRK